MLSFASDLCLKCSDKRIDVFDTIRIGDFSLLHLKVCFSELVTIGFGFRFFSRYWRNQIHAVTLGSYVVLIASICGIGNHLVRKKILLGEVRQNLFQCVGIALMSLLGDRGNDHLNVVFVTTGF
jgi:hypothetical protein